MNNSINSQINEARDLFDQAFRMTEIPKRNKLISRGLEKFEAIEKLDTTDAERQKISSIKTTYSKELLKSLEPFSLMDDIDTFLNLVKMNENYNKFFKDNPHFKKNLKEFVNSLERSPEFQQSLSKNFHELLSLLQKLQKQ